MNNQKLFSVFDGYPDLVAAFSENNFGMMKPTGDRSLDEQIKTNRKKFLKSLGIDESTLVALNQVHEDKVKVAGSLHGGKFITATDALLTNKRNLYLSVRVADCLPIYLFDPNTNTVGLVHAGWRGIVKNIIGKTIKLAKDKLDLNPRDTLTGIGPSICRNHFEVRANVASKFKKNPESVIEKGGKIYIDLRAIAKKQLVEAGIKEENIEISPICTFEDKNYFSFRRDKPKYVEAMMAIIGLKA